MADASERHEAVTAAEGIECKAEETGGRFKPRQADAAGCSDKKILRPAEKRDAVRYLQERFQASEGKGCTVLRINRGWHRRQPNRDEQAFLRMRIKEIASVRKRHGYRRIRVLLLREGWKINHKRVYRLYRQEGLNLRKPSTRKKISLSRALEKGLASAVNECWCMDFLSNQLYNGKRFRALTVLDTFNRESLAIYVNKSIKGEQVCDELEKLKCRTLQCLKPCFHIPSAGTLPEPSPSGAYAQRLRLVYPQCLRNSPRG